MENLTKYALDGLRLKNEELFIKRAYEVINHYDALNFMINGIPSSVKVIDKEKLLNYICSNCPNHYDINITDVKLNNNFNVEVYYSCIYIRYYSNKTDAKDKNYKYEYKKSEEFNIPVEVKDSFYYTIYKNDIETAGLKIELL